MNKLFRCQSRPQDDLRGLRITLAAEIGSGTYAKVFKAIPDDANAEANIAVKIINKKTAPGSFVRKFLARELDVVQRLNHKNIIQTIKVHEPRSSDNIYILTELARTDLLEYMKLKGPLRETLVRRLFYDLSSGIDYMHSNKIVHRDIKCENCLISYDGLLKVADFGFARELDDGELSRTFCGSTVYAAPEILTAHADYDPYCSDVWSCGVVLYVMFTAKMPFGRELLNKFVKLRYVQIPTVPVNLSEYAIRILRGILLFNPEDRLKLKLVAEKKHEWYTANALNTTS